MRIETRINELNKVASIIMKIIAPKCLLYCRYVTKYIQVKLAVDYKLNCQKTERSDLADYGHHAYSKKSIKN